MKTSPLLAAALLAAFLAAPAGAADPAPNAPLVQEGSLVVDATDFHASLLRVPAERRGDVRLSYDRVASVVDNIFLTRSLAERARAAGLDKDPVVQRRMQQAGEAVLADMYLGKALREASSVDLEQRARELYRADPSKFRTEEHVHIQHILVNLQGRTRDQAMERAKMITEKVMASPDEFLTFAQQYSDDPEKRGNRGDLGMNVPKSLSEGMRNAIATMKPGEIRGPVETEHGFHVVKFIKRQPAEQLPFQMVKDNIINAERARLEKERRDQLVLQMRSSPTVTIHRENVEALVVPLPPDVVTGGRLLEEAAKRK